MWLETMDFSQSKGGREDPDQNYGQGEGLIPLPHILIFRAFFWLLIIE